ncbi:hypothetical protein [Tenacibaculum geojense]|uniref:Uncharacterized protein n=1 Tax=Tenacibaculum geojense TaxID=915352 RepID=A0ABW3JNV2_9FLAO
MKKSILNLGKALKKSHQKTVYGGGIPFTHADDPCYDRVNGRRTPGGCPCSEGSDCASGSCYTPGPGASPVCY